MIPVWRICGEANKGNVEKLCLLEDVNFGFEKNLQLACFFKEDNNILKFCIKYLKAIMLSQIINITIKILYGDIILPTFCFTNIAGACIPFHRKESIFPRKDYRASALNFFPRSKRGSFPQQAA